MEIFAGILHDTYPDENGKEVAYTDKVIAVKKGKVYKCVSIPDFMNFEMSKKEFLEKVTDIQKLWSK